MAHLPRVIFESTINLGIIFTGYCYWKAWKNRGDQKKLDEEAEELKDNTRPQNPSFGLSWGAKADLMIMEEIDTGDLLFASYNCGRLVSGKEIIKCYARNFFSTAPRFDEVGIALRYPNELVVMSNSLGKVSIEEYPQYIAKVYKSKIIARKIKAMTRADEKALYLKTKQLLDDEIDFRQKNGDEFPSVLASRIGLIDSTSQKITPDDLYFDQALGKASQYTYEKEIVIRNNK